MSSFTSPHGKNYHIEGVVFESLSFPRGIYIDHEMKSLKMYVAKIFLIIQRTNQTYYECYARESYDKL